MRARGCICLALVIAGLTVFGGCAPHYYRQDGDKTTFYLRHPSAAGVSLHTSLDGFAPRDARPSHGKWINHLPAEREFSYFYTVDGQLFTPDCTLKEKDDFGNQNCVYLPRL